MEILAFTSNIKHTANTINFHIYIYVCVCVCVCVCIYIYDNKESCTIQKVKILKINLERIHLTWEREDFE